MLRKKGKKHIIKAGKLIVFNAIGVLSLFVCVQLIWSAQAQTSVTESTTNEIQNLTVTASFADKASITPDTPIELNLSRPLQTSEGKLAIIIGQTDVTALFSQTEKGLSYTPTVLPLPAGENSLVVYLVSINNEWKVLVKFPLHVEKMATTQTQIPDTKPQQPESKKSIMGFEKFEFKPSLTLNISTQSAVLYFPFSNRPERINNVDLTLQGSLQSNIKRGIFESQGQFDVVGSTYQKGALRFGENGDDAPQIDLSSYLIQFQIGKVKVNTGHISYGTNRYLINSFSSRGITVSVPITSRMDFSFAAANGTSIVGWNNFLGLNRRKHRIVSGTFGFEFFKERQSGLRFETSIVRGSLLPLNNFNQGNVNDTEESSGIGFRILGSDKSERLRFDAGFARSKFDNPVDQSLNQGFDVVPVNATTRNAQYLDFSFDLMKDWSLTETRKANLTFTFRHDRVDPLYRSVAAFTQADKMENQFELTGSIGDITATFAHNRGNDNLPNIISILKTLTRRNYLMLSVPLVSVFGDKAKPSVWFPRLSYNIEQTHQYGAFLPVNADFALTHVPDQMNTNQTFNTQWQGQLWQWRFGYRFNSSFQDNRQIGREQSDLKNLINAFTFGLSPHQKFDFEFELSRESAFNLEQNQMNRTWRGGVNINWRMTENILLTAMTSTTFAGDVANTNRSRNAELDLQWSWRFKYERDSYRKMQGQFFIRYANRYAYSRDFLFDFRNLTKLQTINAGMSFTFF